MSTNPQRIADELRTYTALDWQRLQEACSDDDFASLAALAGLENEFDGSIVDEITAELQELGFRLEEVERTNAELRVSLARYQPDPGGKPGIIGATMGTRSGKVFDFLNPTPDMIDIQDIAWGLAREGRFGNQLRGSIVYNVAQHSCLVAFATPEEHRLSALLHDATEAYVGDMVGPLKQLCPDYRAVEERVWSAIAKRFGISEELNQSVKVADLRALHTEKLAFSSDPRHDWRELDTYPPIVTPTPLSAWGVEQSAEAFLSEFYRLSADRDAA